MARRKAGSRDARGARRGSRTSRNEARREAHAARSEAWDAETARLEDVLRECLIERATRSLTWSRWFSTNYNLAAAICNTFVWHRVLREIIRHPLFETIILLTIVLNTLLLSIVSYNKPADDLVNTVSGDADPYILGIFCVEMAMKLVVMGFGYFRDGWNILDAIVVSTGLVEVLSDAGGGVSALRVARVLRPLRVAHSLPGLKRLVATIFVSVKFMGNITVVYLYILVIFGLLGMSLFQGVLRRRCVGLAVTDVLEGGARVGPYGAAEILVRGGDDHLGPPEILEVERLVDWTDDPYDPETGLPLPSPYPGYALIPELDPELGRPVPWHELDASQTCTNTTNNGFPGFLCPAGTICLGGPDLPNINEGVTSFDNFLYTSLTNFQVTTLEGWTFVMYRTMDATSGWALIFFVLLVFVGAMFVVNLVLAVITNVYDDQTNQVDTVTEKEDLKHATETLNKIPGMREMRAANRRVRKVLSRCVTALQLPRTGPLGYVRQFCYDITVKSAWQSKAFNWGVTFLIFANLVTLSLYWDGQSESLRSTLEMVNLVMVCCFLTEMVIRLLAVGARDYLAEPYNRIDALVNLLSLIEISLGDQGSLSSLRAMRALRALKLLQRWETLQNFLTAVTACIMQLGNFFLVVVLTLLVFALLGMNLLGGKLDAPPGQPQTPGLATMDTLPWALLYVFQIMTGEDWNELMYAAAVSVGPGISLYFVLVICLGNFIVVNLFIAILLSNFAATHEEQKAQRERQQPMDLSRNDVTRLCQRLGLPYMVPGDDLGGGIDPSSTPELTVGAPQLREKAAVSATVKPPPPIKEAVSVNDRFRRSVLAVKFSKEYEILAVRRGFFTPDADAAVLLRKAMFKADLLDISGNITAGETAASMKRRMVQRGRLSQQGSKTEDGTASTVGWVGQIYSQFNQAADAMFALKNDEIRGRDDERREIISLLEETADGSGVAGVSEACDESKKRLEATSAKAIAIDGEVGSLPSPLGVKRVPSRVIMSPKGVVVLPGSEAPDLDADEVGAVSGVPNVIARPRGVSGLFASAGAAAGRIRMVSSAFGAESDPEKLAKIERARRRRERELKLREQLIGPCKNAADATIVKELERAVRLVAVAGFEGTGCTLSMEQVENMSKASGVTLSPTLPGKTPLETTALEEAARLKEAKAKRQQEAAALVGKALGGAAERQAGAITKIEQTVAERNADRRAKGAHHEEAWGCPKPLELYKNKSYFLFGPAHPFRQAVFRLVDRQSFDMAILTLIIISSIMMAAETPGNLQNEKFKDTLYWIDVSFTTCFAAEMLLKTLATGWWGDDGAYLLDWWNVMDMAIVSVSLANVLAVAVSGSTNVSEACLRDPLECTEDGDGALGSIRVIRTFRIFRPLRVVRRVPELRLVVAALLRSIPGISSVMIVAIFVWYIFGVIGVYLFSGTFYQCTDGGTPDDPVITRDDCTGDFIDSRTGEIRERRWVNSDQNFDNLGEAMLTLFECSTTEGWVAVMQTAIDAVGVDMQPILNWNPAVSLYFVFFMLVAYFLLINMFVGIVLDNFGQLREEQGSLALLTDSQRKWVMAQMHVMSGVRIASRGRRPRGASLWMRARGRCYDIIVHPTFDVAVAGLISLNTVILLSQHFEQPDFWTDFLTIVDYIFFSLYVVEAALKIFALGLRGYFSSHWNWLDFFVVAVGAVEASGAAENLSIDATAFRAIRVARVVRVLKTWKGLQVTFQTLFSSLPSMVNVGGLMFLVFWMYAVLGMNLFGEVNLNPPDTGDGDILNVEINKDANFTNVGRALLTLLRMATGEAWNGIMHSCMRSGPPYCCPSGTKLGDCPPSTQPGDCGSPAAAVIFFVTFSVICAFILINLFLAIVIDNYSTITAGTIITHNDVSDFQLLWAQLDIDGTGYLPARKLVPLLEVLPAPLGTATVDEATGRVVRAKREEIVSVLEWMQVEALVLDENADPMVFYKDVLVGLSCHYCKVDIDELPEGVRVDVAEKAAAQRSAMAVEEARSRERMRLRREYFRVHGKDIDEDNVRTIQRRISEREPGGGGGAGSFGPRHFSSRISRRSQREGGGGGRGAAGAGKPARGFRYGQGRCSRRQQFIAGPESEPLPGDRPPRGGSSQPRREYRRWRHQHGIVCDEGCHARHWSASRSLHSDVHGMGLH